MTAKSRPLRVRRWFHGEIRVSSGTRIFWQEPRWAVYLRASMCLAGSILPRAPYYIPSSLTFPLASSSCISLRSSTHSERALSGLVAQPPCLRLCANRWLFTSIVVHLPHVLHINSATSSRQYSGAARNPQGLTNLSRVKMLY
jgi:hypothetical protein